MKVITHMKMTETLLIYALDTGGRGGANGSVKFFFFIRMRAAGRMRA